MHKGYQYDLETPICWFCENGSEKASGQWSMDGRLLVNHNIYNGDIAPYCNRFKYCPVCGGLMYTMDRTMAMQILKDSIDKHKYTEDELDAIHFTCDLFSDSKSSIFSQEKK